MNFSKFLRTPLVAAYYYKIISNIFAARLKKVPPYLISTQRNAYASDSESRISCLLDLTEKLKIKGYLVTVDIEKAFDSLEILVLEKTSSRSRRSQRFFKILQNTCVGVSFK